MLYICNSKIIQIINGSFLETIFLEKFGEIQKNILENLEFDVIMGIPTASIPFATALSWLTNKPLQMIRKTPKKHGLIKIIEGPSIENKKILLVDDLISSGFSKEFAINEIRKAKGKISELVVLIDRREYINNEWENKHDVILKSLFQLNSKDIITYYSLENE